MALDLRLVQTICLLNPSKNVIELLKNVRSNKDAQNLIKIYKNRIVLEVD